MMQKVVFLGMGGTIAGKAADAADNVGYKAGEVSVDILLQGVPGLVQALQGCGTVSEQVAQMDSSSLGFAEWWRLAERAEAHLRDSTVRGIVVTHGTDTLEETAYFLARVLPPDLLGQKPVVLTCAMRPSTSTAPDGPGNLRDATAVAVCAGASGVVAVCAGRIHSALHVRKVHPYRLDAFDSGDASVLGFVEEGRVRLLMPWASMPVPPGPQIIAADVCTKPIPWVEAITSHAAASGRGVRAWCADMGDAMEATGEARALKAGTARLQGIVVATTGNGTIHKDLNEALMQAQALGVRVVRVTRCMLGQIVPPHTPATGADPGSFEVWGLSPVKARLELALQLLATT